MRLIAITGSIGCGKTTIARMIREEGYTVFDVDAWVRRLYFNREFINRIREVFPGTVDRARLKTLEEMTHPFLRRYLKSVIRRNSRRDDLFFLDVALLFEMGWEIYCDRVVVADVDYEIQKRRVMERDLVAGEDFDKINNVQMSNEKKKQMADAVIDTDKPKNVLKLEVITLLNELEKD